MTIKNMQDFLDRKNGGKCEACGVPHEISKPCSREQLAYRIMALMQANAGIPDLLKQKKEAVEVAASFQVLLKKADEAHTILMYVLSRYGEVGDRIRSEYLERLDAWTVAKDSEPTKHDTSEQLNLFNREQ